MPLPHRLSSNYVITYLMNFSEQLINWYLLNKRELPWRGTSDPYKIWISEIILQQTRVNQGLSYYERFIRRFPDVAALSDADEDEVLKYWQGLGYYSRARNLHAAAHTITSAYNGIFPTDYQSVLKLKGIGEYTAAAVCSFAYGLPYAAVDGNVYRVLSRFFGIETPIDSNGGKKVFSELAQELLDKKRPGLHNQAMMDLGATVCTPSSPTCNECPLQDGCYAFANRSWTNFPVKKQKTKQRNRYFYYFHITGKNGKTYLHKREKNDIWKNLYELPLIETERELSEEEIQEKFAFQPLETEFENLQLKKVHPTIKHILSHQHIYACFIEAEANYRKPENSVFLEIDESKTGDYAVSRLTEIFLS
ncbi:MAG: A/G-specific adenine glycosylase [Prevotellaceae bacterium]|nr:A/G-specific adenine glycosylase [Prevotellaceae bacterium]